MKWVRRKRARACRLSFLPTSRASAAQCTYDTRHTYIHRVQGRTAPHDTHFRTLVAPKPHFPRARPRLAMSVSGACQVPVWRLDCSCHRLCVTPRVPSALLPRETNWLPPARRFARFDPASDVAPQQPTPYCVALGEVNLVTATTIVRRDRALWLIGGTFRV